MFRFWLHQASEVYGKWEENGEKQHLRGVSENSGGGGGGSFEGIRFY